jgi:hypothetical protein
MYSYLIALLVLLFGNADYACSMGEFGLLYEDGSITTDQNDNAITCIDAVPDSDDDGTWVQGVIITVRSFTGPDGVEYIGAERIIFDRNKPFPDECCKILFKGYREDFLSIVR